jgi:transcriptional regulator with XRE-family HTH domain
MADIGETLRIDLQDPEFSEGYAESFLDTFVATQIKVLREQRGLTQKQLAKKLGTSQGVISRTEDADYAAWNINTLKKLARVFEVRLHVSFETVGSLIGDVKKFGRRTLERTPRSKDPVLLGTNAKSTTSNAYQISLFGDAQKSQGGSTPISPAPSAGMVSRKGEASQVGTVNKISSIMEYRQRVVAGRVNKNRVVGDAGAGSILRKMGASK